LSSTTSHRSWLASHRKACPGNCSHDTAAANAGCNATASSASPDSIAATPSAVIHHTTFVVAAMDGRVVQGQGALPDTAHAVHRGYHHRPGRSHRLLQANHVHVATHEQARTLGEVHEPLRGWHLLHWRDRRWQEDVLGLHVRRVVAGGVDAAAVPTDRDGSVRGHYAGRLAGGRGSSRKRPLHRR
jgi:hypothetical protein